MTRRERVKAAIAHQTSDKVPTFFHLAPDGLHAYYDVPWAGIYNTISCAASHHFQDGRWMQDSSVMEECVHF